MLGIAYGYCWVPRGYYISIIGLLYTLVRPITQLKINPTQHTMVCLCKYVCINAYYIHQYIHTSLRMISIGLSSKSNKIKPDP